MKRLGILKKIMALIVSVGMLGSLCACSDQTWSVKAGDTSMTMGSYVLFEYEAYNEAMQKLGISQQSSERVAISNKKIDDKKASEWIKEKTLEKCKMFLYVANKFKEMNLSFTDDEKKEMDANVDNYWGQVQSTWEKKGVAKESFAAVVGEYPKKAEKIFKAIYGKGGTNPVSDDDLEKYIKENYLGLYVVQKSLLKASENAQEPTKSSEKLSEDEINKLKSTYEDYVAKINAGSMSLNSLAEKLKASNDQLQPQLARKDELNFGDEINEKIKSLEVNKAYAVIKDDALYLFINGSLDSLLKELKSQDEKRSDEEKKAQEDMRYRILSEMKKDEFSESTKNIEVTVNESGIKSFPPSIFDQTDEQQQQGQQ
jgi:hypothetical protein